MNGWHRPDKAERSPRRLSHVSLLEAIVEECERAYYISDFVECRQFVVVQRLVSRSLTCSFCSAKSRDNRYSSSPRVSEISLMTLRLIYLKSFSKRQIIVRRWQLANLQIITNLLETPSETCDKANDIKVFQLKGFILLAASHLEIPLDHF